MDFVNELNISRHMELLYAEFSIVSSKIYIFNIQ